MNVLGDGFDAVDEYHAATFAVYPNPASGFITINAEEECEFVIFDAVGRNIVNIVTVPGENTINVSSFETGVYFIRMNGTVVRFVKE